MDAERLVVFVLSLASTTYSGLLVHLEIICLKKHMSWASLTNVAQIVVIDTLVVLQPYLLHDVAEVLVKRTLIKIGSGFLLIGSEVF